MYGMAHGGGMFDGDLLMILWWLVPVAIAVAVAAYLSRRSGRSARDDEALEILRQRLARGEIGVEEFQETRRNLGG